MNLALGERDELTRRKLTRFLGEGGNGRARVNVEPSRSHESDADRGENPFGNRHRTSFVPVGCSLARARSQRSGNDQVEALLDDPVARLICQEGLPA
jgi:hypothetical protein